MLATETISPELILTCVAPEATSIRPFVRDSDPCSLTRSYAMRNSASAEDFALTIYSTADPATFDPQRFAQQREANPYNRYQFKLPGYENWPGYANNLQFIARRYCGLWGRGT